MDTRVLELKNDLIETVDQQEKRFLRIYNDAISITPDGETFTEQRQTEIIRECMTELQDLKQIRKRLA